MRGTSSISKYLIVSIIIIAVGVPTAYAITITLGGDPVIINGILDLMGNRITNVGTPTVSTDAATKGYADSLALGVDALSSRLSTLENTVGVAANCSATGPNVDLHGCNLSGENFFNADLSGADLRSADLSFADLSFADLSNTNLSFADLSGANLFTANLSGASLNNAVLIGAFLSGADFTDALNQPTGNIGCIGTPIGATFTCTG